MRKPAELIILPAKMQFLAAVALSGLALVNAQSAPVPGVTGQLGDAAVTTGNPSGVTYIATLPNKATTNIRGYVSASSNADGTGVFFNVNLFGFPSESLGPFRISILMTSIVYHIHDQPVPANGNCTATLAHLDPYIRGEKPPCDPAHPATCQVGDLAGKHGNITSPGLQTSYSDLYVATKQGLGSFVGNRSIVVHTSNTTRLTCANFVLSSGASPSGTGASASATGAGSGSPTSPASSPIAFAGGATTNFISGGVVVGLAFGVIAFLL
ncbi:uncharacterized protein KY384_002173 [Bacidia gigantensis]|uniref:uncharacterized protein n=1 Tax=Bacidia gigantensis TaxID=2732470 RepID=UPI001D056D08|nr:uncharacterized protein KY384_002173 [Bacidia gigantensis]KAG8533390.1 hypothetical protein KY384_002173 [Bacidia gigantensis]